MRRKEAVYLPSLINSDFPLKEVAGSNPVVATNKKYCGMVAVVARWAHNPKVGGSNPSPATKIIRGCSSNEERLSVKQRVVSSSLTIPATF